MKKLTNITGAIALCAHMASATDAGAMEGRITEGSIQNNGDLCFNMTKFNEQDPDQPNGTVRLCRSASGQVTGEQLGEGEHLQRNVICVVAPDPRNYKRKIEVACPWPTGP